MASVLKRALSKIRGSNPTSEGEKTTTRRVGAHAEKLAKTYLVKAGLQVHTQNYHCPHGEIDLVLKDNDCWVFAEVRYRNSVQFGGGSESVDLRKQQKLIRTAEFFMQHHTDAFESCRFDVIAMSGPLKQVKIEWIKDAFC